MDKIFITNLEVQGILGIHAHEQRAPQKILINVTVLTDVTQAAEHDDILRTVNYSTMMKEIIHFVETSHYYTIEALIEALAGEILKIERVQSVKLRIEKPQASARAESVGVEIVRNK